MMKIIIIGGGAAGLTAAVYAAKKGASVTVLEHTNKTGKKLLITGNGRCNITNTDMDMRKFYGNRGFIETVLAQFNETDTIDFFHSMGIRTKNKNGYIYPAGEQASTVSDTLRDYALSLGVSIKTNNHVDKIKPEADGFDVHTGVVLHCDKLILATGGMSYPKTGSTGEGYQLAEALGHHISEPMPALTALICEKNSLNRASGVRCSAKITIQMNHSPKDSGICQISDIGELQITEYGISGIPVFNISRYAKEGSQLTIDFLPDYDMQKTNKLILEVLKSRSYLPVSRALGGIMNEKLSEALLIHLGISKSLFAKDISQKDAAKIADCLKAFPLTVRARRGFEFAQITQGGVNTGEINAKTMESLLVENLYFAGEMIDVDGICGGYNLQFAWATGALAGGNAAQ